MTNWVIMPFYGALDLTRQAAMDVLAQTLEPLDLLLIDTSPTRESRELCRELRAFSPRVWHWHHDPSLPSLSATWNYALNTIWTGGADYAWVVNNDVRLHPQTYEALVRGMHATGAWFLTAANVRDQWQEVKHRAILPWDDQFLVTRGGPDFSCFLIHRDCHRYYQFDEQFQPAYHEDNDYHRRLTLAGWGSRIFSLSIPYWHLGSGTLHANAALAAAWGPKFEACRNYYVQKWGGLPHHETYKVPFQMVQRDGDLGFDDFRVLLLGQGRREVPDDVLLGAYRELYGGQ